MRPNNSNRSDSHKLFPGKDHLVAAKGEGIFKETSKDEWLWTGESVFCKCSHNVDEHCTHCYQSLRLFHCHKCNECTSFVASKIRHGTHVETKPLEEIKVH